MSNELQVIVNIKTVASHDKEYRSLEFHNWNPYVIQRFLLGDSVPAGSIFLFSSIGEWFYFQVPRLKPRSLPVLDDQIKLFLSLYFQPEELSTTSKLLNEIHKFIEDKIFQNKEEKDWWRKYRELEIETTIKNMIEINIIGK